MKKRGVYVLLLSCFLLSSKTFSQAKHALIFAIGNYPPSGGWPTISSLRDVGYIETVLKKQGFNDIKLVADSQATVKGISNALDDLIQRVKAGDVVVIHFSSHGEQVQDDNGDETDGLDECIVTYNATLPQRGEPLSREAYDKFQANYYRDDLFGSYIDKLRAKLGKDGDVVVFMDLCHSGTGTRGIAKVRGGKPPLVSNDFDAAKFAPTDTCGEFKEKDKTRGGENNLATFVVYSAAESGELDYETEDDEQEGVGSLTYAISKVFSNTNIIPTYRSLFARIQTVMNEKTPQQHPVLEGDGLDRKLFGGKFVKQQPYIQIEKINGMELTLNEGKMQGLDSGARVTVYPSGTTSDTSNAALLASGIVIKAGNYSSTVKLDNDLKIKQPTQGWVFLSEPAYNMEPLGINVVSNNARGTATHGFSKDEFANIKNGLADLPFVRFDVPPDLILVKGETSDSIKVASNGYLFETIKNAPLNTTQLKDAIQHYIQYKFLQGLNIKDKSTKVEVKLIPFTNGKPDTAELNNSLVTIPKFKNGDKFVLWIKNDGDDDAYINILDLQPDGIINKVLPDKQKNIYPGDLKISGGSSFLFSQYPITVGPPYGTEIFKIFVSTQKIDMEDIATTRGAGTRGNLSVLEALVQRSYGAGTRGVETNNIGNADGSCFNLLFEIIPK